MVLLQFVSLSLSLSMIYLEEFYFSQLTLGIEIGQVLDVLLAQVHWWLLVRRLDFE